MRHNHRNTPSRCIIQRLPAGIIAIVVTATLGCSLGGCARGGLRITNTSNTDQSFSASVEGGEQSWTLKPGSTLNLGRGSVFRTADYTVQAN